MIAVLISVVAAPAQYHKKGVVVCALAQSSTLRFGPSDLARPSRKPDLPPPGDISEEYVNTLLPQVAGCSARREIAWHHRRHVFYVCPECGTNKTFGKAMSEAKVVAFIIRWAWSRHAEQGGEICPHDLSEFDL